MTSGDEKKKQSSVSNQLILQTESQRKSIMKQQIKPKTMKAQPNLNESSVSDLTSLKLQQSKKQLIVPTKNVELNISRGSNFTTRSKTRNVLNAKHHQLATKNTTNKTTPILSPRSNG